MDRRPKLFGVVFDLNQTPLSSPRETAVPDDRDDDVVVIEPPALSLPRRNEAPQVAAVAGASPGLKGEGESHREADGDSILCIDCCSQSRPRGPRLVDDVKQWRCFKCLLKDRGGDGVGSRTSISGCGRGGGVALLDINASPPREMEVEAVYAGPGDDVSWDRNHGDKVQAGSYSSFSGRPVGLLSTFSNMVRAEKGFHLPKSPDPKSGCDNVVDHRGPSETGSHMVDFGSTYEARVRATNSIHTDCDPKSPNELYLEGLKEYIAERKGVLGDGWRVEFEFCNKKLKTLAVFCAPDGSRFESLSDVAHHLGLLTNPHPPQSENAENGFLGMPLNQKRKEPSWASNSRERPSIARSSSPRKSLNGSQDGFPIQFEDFYLISAGAVDSRSSYHNNNQIWPVGYRSIWHDKITGSLFVFDIKDGGDSGPNFMVQRYPCDTQAMPCSSTVLSRTKCEDNEDKDDLTRFGTIDEDSISIQMMLTESSPPHLDDDDISSASMVDNACDSQKGNLPSSDSFSQMSGNFTSDILGQKDGIGEFAVEGRSPSYVWEKVCDTFLHACYKSYDKKGMLQLGCDHYEIYVKELGNVDSLSKFSHVSGPVGTPRVIRTSDEFHSTCELVANWLQQDRTGLDAEFVQEIIEQLPGVSGCSGYTTLTKRKHQSTLQTVGSGFLLAKRKRVGNLGIESDGYFGIFERAKEHSKHSELRSSFPLGKPICSRLPADLIGDALQVWQFLLRFFELLGLQIFSFQELEDELINPWLDGLNTMETLGTEIHYSQDVSFRSSREASEAKVSCHSSCRCTGIILTESHGSLLKVLVGELLSKVATYVDPNFDAGESKSRRGRKKDAEHSAVVKKMKLDMMPVNELTWPEIARRYILAVLSMEGNLDSAEIACRESGKVFHCLRGDGGTLCGSLTGVAALEADALLLAEAMRKIFGSLMTQNEAVSNDENDSDVAAASKTTDANNGELPEWAQVLEPVRKLPTNVGARIRKCVYEALNRNPPEWARKKLEHSISKEVYKGNASGPTKRAVVEVLANVTREKLHQKPEKKEKVKTVYIVSDLIMKQCRIVLRRALSADEDRVFCNLLARTLLNPNDNDDEGILGYPAMVSRPLDFRTIDMRLAAGAYGGSHEAFFDDVREVWHNVCTAYKEQSDLIELAETLSQQFDDLYKKEVLTFVLKTMGVASSSESEKERDDMLAQANDCSLPKAPWEEGICKVCGMDKDDDNVLLCDSCDSEYHTYCLSPPLIRIPEGNWYCPSCVTGKSFSQTAAYGAQIVNQSGKRRYQRKHIDEILERLAQLANKMDLKEYWEFTVGERVFLIKFLCDEAINSAIFREHIEQCTSLSVDLQQRLRSFNSERKILKLKEESLAPNVAETKGNAHSGGGELGSNGLAPMNVDEAQLPDDKKISLFSGGSMQIDGGHPEDRNDFSDQSCCYSRSIGKPFNSSNSQSLKTASAISENVDNLRTDVNLHQNLGDSSSSVSVQSTSQPMLGNELSGTVSKHMAVHASNQTSASSSQEYNAEFSILQQEISGLQESINTAESELLKVSFRKEFLGRDSYGRLYWDFSMHGASPSIVVNGNLNAGAEFGLDNLFPKSTSWMYYDAVTEIEELVNWLDDCDARERELKESILQWQSNKSLQTDCNRKDIFKGKPPSSSTISSGQRDANPNVLVSKAVIALEKKFGPVLEMGGNHIHKNMEHDSETTYEGRMYRCECLELFWPSRHHCFSCHKTFTTSEEFALHGEKCTTVATGPESSQLSAGSLKHKKMVKNQGVEICSGSSDIPHTFLNAKYTARSNCYKHPQELECPFNFEEIMSKFKTENSLKELIKDIGLIGTKGVVPFVPNCSPCLDDPALSLVPLRDNEVSRGDQTSVAECERSDNVANVLSGVKDKFSDYARSIENDKGEVSEVECIKPRLLSERGQLSTMKDRSSISISRSVIRESSLRPKVGKASEILQLLKINLLDIDAALPEAALRASRSHLERRCAWRTFVKSANTIFEMVQALIILEDTIRTDYLRNDWWYWSSPSAAANISTLSALAFRVHTLDSAIFYEKPSTDDTTGTWTPDGKSDKDVSPSAIPTNSLKPADQPMQKMHDSDSGENSRPRTRMSRRKKDSNG